MAAQSILSATQAVVFRFRNVIFRDGLVAVAVLLAIGVVVKGALDDRLQLGPAALFTVLAPLTVLALMMLYKSLRGGNPVEIESNWGGLGGGLGGWRFSQSFTWLLVSGTLLAGLSAVTMNLTAPAHDLLERYRAVVNLAQRSNASGVEYQLAGHKVVFKATTSADTRAKLMDLVTLINPAMDDISVDIQVAEPKTPDPKPAPEHSGK